jgi:hypothetical protein
MEAELMLDRDSDDCHEVSDFECSENDEKDEE